VADLIKQLESGTPGERVIAAERLGDLGPAAADAIPALARAVRSAPQFTQHQYHAALDALLAIGPKAAPALVELLPYEKKGLFRRVGSVLRSFGKDAAPIVPALAKMLADDDQDFRVEVAGLLEEIGPSAEAAVPELVGLFLNPKNKTDVRWGMSLQPRAAAVQALVRIGPKAAPALKDKVLPVLIAELKTGEYVPGGTPPEVLGVLGDFGAPVVPTVVALIRKDERGHDRSELGRTLLGLGAAGERAFGELLADPDSGVRREMIAALEAHLLYQRFPAYYRFSSRPLDITPYVPALVAALKDGEAKPETRLIAAELLCRLGDKAPRGTVEAVAALFDDRAVRQLVANNRYLLHEPALMYFGEAGVRALVRLFDSDRVAIREMAVNQLSHDRRWMNLVLPRLRKLADDPDPELALTAIYTVAKLSLDPKEAAPLVNRRFLRSPDPKIRASAAKHLGWLGPLGVPHTDVLIPLLGDADPEVVQAAAGAIHRAGPKNLAAWYVLTVLRLAPDRTGRFVPTPVPEAEPAEPGIADLIDSVSGGGDHQRTMAALELGEKGAAAKGALPALKKALVEPSRDLRFAAAYAIARIENDAPGLRWLLVTELERAVQGRSSTWVAAEAFARLPPDYPECVPLIARWLERESESTLMMAGLPKYGPKAKAAVPALRKSLRGPTGPVHFYLGVGLIEACEALGAIGPDAKDALPELRQRANIGSVEVAPAARDAIRKITGEK
jgi:HEAT repeat protein